MMALEDRPAVTLDLSESVPCDLCGGERTVAALAVRALPDGRREERPTRVPCSRCRGRGTRPAHADPMAAPYIDVSVPATHGSVRLTSSSGEIEALWVTLRDDGGNEVVFHAPIGEHRPPPVRLTPSQARALSDALRRYADTHVDTCLDG